MNKEVQQQGFQHKCANCGSPLQYNPETGKLYCQHCQSHFDFEKSTQVIERHFDEMNAHGNWDESKVAVFRCENCGASSVLPRTALALECVFCGSPIVIDETKTGLIRPDSLIPFELTAKNASTQLASWRKKRLFAPNKFRKKTKESSVKGVFLPSWTFDAYTVSNYSGTLGKTRTRTVRRNGKTYTETYTDWFPVVGTIERLFDDIFVRANENISAKHFSKLGPFDKNKYVVYSDEYLAGYVADNYTIDVTDAFEVAKQRMHSEIHRAIMVRHNADVDGSLTINTNILDKSFKYMMLPVYVATTKYHQKVYNQYVSGVYHDQKRAKAKVCGKAPVSPWKVVAAVIAGIAALVGIGYLMMMQ